MRKRFLSLALAMMILIGGMIGFPMTAGAAGTLTYGDRNDDVYYLQDKLRQHGYFDQNSTGYYGAVTRSAVIAFQEDNGLTADGVVGVKTWQKLESSASSNATQKNSNTSSTNDGESSDSMLRTGIRSEAVSKLQRRLDDLGYYNYHAVTGYFGPVTDTAIRNFQRANGLKVDGIVGPATHNKIYSSSAVKAADAPKASTTSNSSRSQDSSVAQQLVAYAKKFLGVPYVYGGNGPKSFDCTGFTSYVYRNFGYSLPRTAYNQGYTESVGKKLNYDQLQVGDLVFFNTNSNSDNVSGHAGIYLGGGQFIHASTSKKSVVISDMSPGTTYNRIFSWGRRALK